jgi:hypothetical protein
MALCERLFTQVMGLCPAKTKLLSKPNGAPPTCRYGFRETSQVQVRTMGLARRVKALAEALRPGPDSAERTSAFGNGVVGHGRPGWGQIRPTRITPPNLPGPADPASNSAGDELSDRGQRDGAADRAPRRGA